MPSCLSERLFDSRRRALRDWEYRIGLEPHTHDELRKTCCVDPRVHLDRFLAVLGEMDPDQIADLLRVTNFCGHPRKAAATALGNLMQEVFGYAAWIHEERYVLRRDSFTLDRHRESIEGRFPDSVTAFNLAYADGKYRDLWEQETPR